ncbi:MAG: uroporphyrinogen decarboxylase family protein [Bacillota bacterium]|jgi:uroporphyrinogen-III decarboxylase
MNLNSFSCPSYTGDEVFLLVKDKGLSFEEIYQNPNSIVDFALLLKNNVHREYCYLPFCHTVEAESMGAHIIPGDESAGARAGGYFCTSFEELMKAKIRYNENLRICKMLNACSILKSRGEQIIYTLSGPLSIINCLADSKVLFKTWRKDEALVKELFDNLLNQLTLYSIKIFESGADIISYADPAGTFDILGPKYSEYISKNFTVPLLKKLSEICDKEQSVFICPITVRSLVKSELVSVGDYSGENIYVACSKSLRDKKISIKLK